MTLPKKSSIITLIALVLLWPHSFLYAKNLFTVTTVYDGDLIACQGYGIIFRVRLAGIDAPEIKRGKRPEQPHAEEARKFLEKLVLGKKVTIKQIALDNYNLVLGKKVTIKQIALDNYNLVLGIVYLDRKSGFFSSDRQNINLEMVKRGFAEIVPGIHKSNIRPYREAEKEAKAKKLNIWSQENYISPKQWRKKR
jgi:endonuclease YncB( thermonuclease family)